MPEQRRTTRSGKESTSSEKSKADSSKSNSKDKPSHTRKTSSSTVKSSTSATKKSSKDLGSEKPKTNGTTKGSKIDEDLEMVGDGSKKRRTSKDGEEEMTVVVPTSKTDKIAGHNEKDDTLMTDGEQEKTENESASPQAKTIAGKITGR